MDRVSFDIDELGSIFIIYGVTYGLNEETNQKGEAVFQAAKKSTRITSINLAKVMRTRVTTNKASKRRKTHGTPTKNRKLLNKNLLYR